MTIIKHKNFEKSTLFNSVSKKAKWIFENKTDCSISKKILLSKFKKLIFWL
jgi:hypothetical protein